MAVRMLIYGVVWVLAREGESDVQVIEIELFRIVTTY